MNINTPEDQGGGPVAFILSAEATRAVDELAAAELLTRSAFIRRLVVEHLRRAGTLSADAPIMPGQSRIREQAR